MSNFDQADAGFSALNEPLGIQFEKRHRDADFDLRDLINYRPHDAPHNDNSESRALINNESSDPARAAFEVARDLLRLEFRSMRSLLHQIQYSEWPYRRFPYVPYCLLFMCGFAWAQALIADSNEETGMVKNDIHNLRSFRQVNGISKIVWRSTINAALYSKHNELRLALLAGLGISSVWSIYRAWRLGTIMWCRYSLEALIKKFEVGQLDERDKGALKGLKWTMLWWINIML
ncbi:uncharacterized protein EAE97_009802 [Botrytis byssoidea]|uniref:Uncharacterized protein n=1 Tax=Botrytis byssoidea TaxID=139641 RepID=A0A9P5LYS6_9HELO|nr:uncharacterized protein EAE97_009802 [Botrytis byssoidea]KAF7928960.1 hypothetical protein EAE97_009802 [Botrytis byssoidea]